MQDVTNVFNLPLNEQGEIDGDISCRRCGYNLRGLREDGRCPECGTAIGLSTRGDLLRFADPTWVEKLAKGMSYILWGIVVSIGVGFVGGCLVGMLGAPEAIMSTLALMASALALYGAWLLTAPDPSRVGEDRTVTARKVVRIGLLFGVLNQAFTIGQQSAGGGPAVLVILLAICVGVCGLVSVAGEFAKFMYLEKLALRIPDPQLAGRARFLRWALSITLAGLVIAGAFAVFGFGVRGATGGAALSAPSANAVVTTPGAAAPDGPSEPTSAPAATTGRGASALGGGAPATRAPGARGAAIMAGILAGVFGLAMIVFGVMALFLYIRISKRFREQADIARATWAVQQ